LATVVAVLGAFGLDAPATAASARPIPSVAKLSMSRSEAFVGERATFSVTLRNSGSRASHRALIAIRLSKSGSFKGSTVIRRGTLASVPRKSSRTFRFDTRIPANVTASRHHVLICRAIGRKHGCADKGRFKVKRHPAKLAIEPGATVNFGPIAEGVTSPSRRLVVRNVGQKPTGDIKVGVDGGDDEHFRISATSCRDRSLGAGGACSVYVVFRPKDDGKLDSRLKADPAEGKSVTAKLVGVGRQNDDVVEDDNDEVHGDDSPGVGCTTSANATGTAPASVLNLTNWKLTLPVDGCDDDKWADEVTQPQLASFRDSRYFTVNSARGVVFRAHVAGARTSSNTKYPRSELREMTDRGEKRASWSNKSSGDGVHRLTMEAAITASPLNKPHVVAAQIHDSSDDVIMVRSYGKRLVVDANDSKVQLLLDDDYTLGERFTVTITASNGNIRVVYNGTRTVDYRFGGSGMYFKAGCYTLSNTSYDRADRFGEVVIYKLSVSHS
jgi:hypothetical protein